jgi:hypothetical protein
MPYRLIEPVRQLNLTTGKLNEKVDDLIAAILTLAHVQVKTAHFSIDVLDEFGKFREILKNRE